MFELLETVKDNKIDDKFGDVYLEIVVFYVHYIDRIDFQHLGADRRSTFIDALFVEVREQLSRAYEGGVEADVFRYEFTDAYNERQDEYGQYQKTFPQKDEPAGGTLFWEFGTKIADMLKSAANIFMIDGFLKLLFNSLTALQLPELFEADS